jgi:BlaI family transcriptional regulator, penicillinase repressor
MTERNGQRPPLTGLQQAILESLWSEGEATAERIREALRPEHRLKDSSVRTLLRRLESRGYVSHVTEGKTFVYRAEIPANGIAAGAVREIIRRFCAGSVEKFLVGMVDEKVVSAKDLERLARKVRKR